MTYDKETRSELMEDELREDLIRDEAHDYDDGAMDCWIHDNHSDLVNEFVEENSEGFKEYCKLRWNEVNE